MLLLAGLALAQDDPERVFVSEFQAVDPQASAMAALMGGYLVGELERQGFDVVPISEAPRFGEHSAEVYLDSCPPGQYLGCAFVVADSVDSNWAVAGQVRSGEDTWLVHISIIDVTGSREALSVDLTMAVGEDQRFAEAVAQLLASTMEGELGRSEDIREEGEEEPVSTIDPALVGAQLDELALEMGDLSATARSGGAIERPEYTLEDLAKEEQTDATKPWEALEMTPKEYIRYKNSGLPVSQWREVMSGRKGTLFLRADLSTGRGPWSSEYRGWYALDPNTLENLEQRAWQATTASTGFGAQGWVGYGVTPTIEVQLGGGVMGGRYAMHIQQEIVGDTPVERPVQEAPALQALAGARVMVAPAPWLRVRPLVGGGALLVLQEGTGANFQPPSVLPILAGNRLWLVQVLPGVEASAGDRVDLWATVPVSVMVAGSPTQTYSAGVQGNISTYTEPPAAPVVSAGVELGFAVRVGGASPTGR